MTMASPANYGLLPLLSGLPPIFPSPPPEGLPCGWRTVGFDWGIFGRSGRTSLAGAGPVGLDGPAVGFGAPGDLGNVGLSVSILLEAPGAPEDLLCRGSTVGSVLGTL